jgi:hypothetical protein
MNKNDDTARSRSLSWKKVQNVITIDAEKTINDITPGLIRMKDRVEEKVEKNVDVIADKALASLNLTYSWHEIDRISFLLYILISILVTLFTRTDMLNVTIFIRNFGHFLF